MRLTPLDLEMLIRNAARKTRNEEIFDDVLEISNMHGNFWEQLLVELQPYLKEDSDG